LRPDTETAETLKARGNAQRAAGDLEGAAATYRRSLELAPDYAPSLYNLGLVLRELGRTGEAEACFRRAVELDPRDADALVHLGSLLVAASRPQEAAEAFQRALRLNPGNAPLWVELGTLCHRLGDFDRARECLEKSLELDAERIEAHVALGNVLMAEGRMDDAITYFRAALARSPTRADLHNNLGCALAERGLPEAAAASFRAALALQPGFANAYLNLGDLLARNGSHEQALELYASGMRANPEDAAFVDRALFCMQQVCEWSGFEDLCARRRSYLQEYPERTTAPLSLLAIPSSAAEQLACARAFSRQLSERAASARRRLNLVHAPPGHGRIKVGYLSGDFPRHIADHMIAEMLELHDRGAFEISAYSSGAPASGERGSRLAAAVERCVDLGGVSDADAARRICADGVEILVDLNGLGPGARAGILALRPAPIQVNYLGFPGTMGADFVDYIVLDRFLLQGAGQSGFSERAVVLPDCYAPYDGKRDSADRPARGELGLPEGGFVFACLNETFKILPDLFAAWMRILREVPGSVLWLLDGGPAARDNLGRAAAGHGVERGRLVFAPRTAPDQRLGRLLAADLLLDTHPYSAQDTAADALRLGLPVLTRAGETFASRIAGSLLTAAGLPELITDSEAAYSSLAVRLAHAPDALAVLRAKVARCRNSAPLFDTPRFTRNLERAYRRMAELRASGHPPSAIEG